MRAYLMVTGLIFALLALAHVARLFTGWPVQMGDFTVPVAASWIGLLLPTALAAWAFSLLRKTPPTV